MNKKKCKIILPIVLAAVVLAGAGIWQATRPKEVTNYDVEFEAVQEAPGQETSESSSGSAIQIPGYKFISIPAGTRDVSVELMNPEENRHHYDCLYYNNDKNPEEEQYRVLVDEVPGDKDAVLALLGRGEAEA